MEPRRGPSHFGPYGQACISCFKSKCKCVARPDGPGCQRCHRLRKDCEPSNPERRQTLQKKKDSDARLAQLEAKLDGLISRLGTHEALDDDDHVTDDTIDADRILRAGTRTNNRVSRLPAQALDPEISAGSPQGYFTAASEEPGALQRDPDPASVQEDESGENLLSTFQSRLLPHFPFVSLPPDLTAHQLRAERPLLLQAIVCISSRRHERSRCRELRRTLSEALLEEETDRMDLLLSLMTYLSWGRDHSSPIMLRLMLQAISLAYEMQHAPSTTNPGGLATPEVRELFLPGATAQRSPGPGDFLEHHRAILGCFVLSSAVSSHLNHRIDALRWTQQMGEGLAALGASRDCPTDATFMRLIRLQLLAQQAVQIRQQCQQQMEQSSGHHMRSPAGTTPATTALMSLGTLEGELQGLRASSLLPTTGAGNMAATGDLAHVWATDLVIKESRYAVGSMVPFMVSHFTAIAMSSVSGGTEEGAEGGRVAPPRNGERAWCLWQCVKAAQACIDVLLTGLEDDPTEFANISLLQWIQLAGSLDALHYLTFRIEDPSWDRAALTGVVHVGDILDRVAGKLELATAAMARGGEGVDAEEFLHGTVQRMRDFCAVLRGGGLGRDHQAGQDSHGHSELGRNTRDLFHIPLSDFVA